MTAISVRLTDDLSSRLDKLAERTGRSKTFYIRKALLEHIEDMEDLALAEQRLSDLKAGRSRSYPLQEVIRELGLED
jgi:RHH-type rel operon transcriptional repressor/antitoxin RelB